MTATCFVIVERIYGFKMVEIPKSVAEDLGLEVFIYPEDAIRAKRAEIRDHKIRLEEQEERLNVLCDEMFGFSKNKK